MRFLFKLLGDAVLFIGIALLLAYILPKIL